MNFNQRSEMSRPWDAEAPLERGVTLLEASAGTGKTYQIVHIVMRLIAEYDVPIEEILVMTFTRAATAELKERLHHRLQDGYDALEPDAPPPYCDDGTLQAWSESLRLSDQHREARRRLGKALTGFDRAAISTIHGFCQRMLTRFAFESDTSMDIEPIADIGPLTTDLAIDFITRTGFDADDPTWTELAGKGDPNLKKWNALAQLALADRDAPADPRTDGFSLFDEVARERVLQAVAPARAFWAAHGPQIVATVDELYRNEKLKPTARKTKYSPDKNAAHGEILGAWLANPFDVKPSTTVFAHFVADEMRKYAGRDDLDLPASFDAFVDVLEALKRRLRGWPPDIYEETLTGQFVEKIREDWVREVPDKGKLAFQDLLEGLADALNPSKSMGAARLGAAMRGAFRAVLVDEFQDTDRLQWTIFDRTFADSSEGWLFLIGDPKQAIYAFRGANIHVYFEASRRAEHRRYTLTTNFRSDGALVCAFNHIFGQRHFFEVPLLHYSPNGAARHVARLRPGSSLFADGPFHVRQMPGQWSGGTLRKTLPRRVARDIAELLASDARIADSGDEPRPLHAGDIAVVVKGHQEGAAVSRALFELGIANVRASSGSIFESEAFEAVLRWLALIMSPDDEGARRLFALSPLVGWTADDLAVLRAFRPEDGQGAALFAEWLHLGQRVHVWRSVATRAGILAAWRRMLDDEAIEGRLLTRTDGDRLTTDLRHLVELLHLVQTSERRGLLGLWQWLEDQRDHGARDEHPKRLERDDAAVRILTMHASKGLQFPIVFAPFLWSFREPETPLLVTDPVDPTRRVLVLADHFGAASIARQESREEQLRLLYVAWTRARFGLVTYTAAVGDSKHPHLAASALGSALHAGPEWRVPSASEASDASRVEAAEVRIYAASSARGDAQSLEELITDDIAALAANPAAHISASIAPIERTPLAAVQSAFSPTAHQAPLSARRFTRASLKSPFSLMSYTSLLRDKEDTRAASPERDGADYDAGVFDEAALDLELMDVDLGLAIEQMTAVIPSAPVAQIQAVPLAVFPAGAEAGIALHGIYEDLDFPAAAAVDAEEAVADIIRTRLRRHGLLGAVKRDLIPQITEGFRLSLVTPLGGPVGDFSLAQLARPTPTSGPGAALRLDELRFDFPLAGGTAFSPTRHTPASGRTLARAFATITGHPASPTLMAARYAEALAALDFGPLAGLFKGFIDLVFRAPTPAGPRYFVADYKSNRLKPTHTTPDGGRVWGPDAYQHAAMRYEMEHHHYHLQSSLYMLALHRFLKVRLGAQYDYDSAIGGAYYLFVRGMTGADAGLEIATPPEVSVLGPAMPAVMTLNRGVWFERPPRELIEALDAALPGHAIPTVARTPGDIHAR